MNAPADDADARDSDAPDAPNGEGSSKEIERSGARDRSDRSESGTATPTPTPSLPGTPLIDPDEDPEVLPRMLTDRYRLERLLAKGGMGRVYVATQLPLEREVAVKVLVAPPNLKGDFRRRFLLEASVCARLTHPNIVVVHDYGESSDGDLFMAMELLKGQPLNQVMKETGPFDPARAVWISLQIARALRQAHREGVAHRDLKPGNVFLEERRDDPDHVIDVVKVLDFGLVKVFEESRPAVDRDLTQGDMMLGSPRFMSPEQIRCEHVDARSDIYSLGVVLYSMICSRPPFVGQSPIEILTGHLQREPPPFAQVFAESTRYDEMPYPVPAELQEVVFRCMRKDPEERYQAIEDLIKDLKVLLTLTGGDGAVDVSSSTPRLSLDSTGSLESFNHPTPTPLPIEVEDTTGAQPAARRSPLPLLLLVGAIVVGGAAAILWPSAPPPEPPPPVEEPSAPTQVQVTITSEPPGAEVMSGGVSLGATPVTHTFPPTPAGARRVFTLSLDGYLPGRIAEPIEGETLALSATLEPVPEPEPEPPVVAETEPEPAEMTQRMFMRMRPAPMETMTTAVAMETPMETPMMDARVREIVVMDHGRVPIVD